MPSVSPKKAAQPVDIVTVAMAIRAMDDESRRRQMAAMSSQRKKERRPLEWEAGPVQENAIRIMEDRTT